MSQKVSIAYQVSAAPNTSNYVTIYTVPAARRLKNSLLIIFFPVGNFGQLQLAFYYGNTKLLPTSGYYAGDGVLVDDDSEAEWGAGSDVKLYYNNTNTTEVREAYILLKGSLE